MMNLETALWLVPVALATILAVFFSGWFRARRIIRRRSAELALSHDELRKQNELVRSLRQRLRETASSLELREASYRTLMENCGDIVFACTVTPEGLTGHFFEVNDIACAKFEYPRERLLTMTPLDIELSPAPSTVPGLTRSQLVTVSDAELMERKHNFAVQDAQRVVKQVMDNGSLTYSRTYVSRTGRKIPVEITARSIDVMGEPIIMCTAHDQTDQQESLRALRDSEQRFQDLFTHSPTGLAIYDAQRELVAVNESCLRMLGIPDRSEFAKFNPFDNPFVPRAAQNSIRNGETTRYEAEIDFEEARRLSMFVTGNKGRANLSIVIQNLGLDRDFLAKGYLVQVQDITKRVQAEAALRQSERQLRQAQKMEAIGTLAGGIAHDFNNILTPIMGYTEMTLYSSKDNPKVQEYLQEVLKASNRAKELVNQILTFSRQAESEGKPIRVIPIVKEVIKLISASAPANIEIERLIKTENDIVIAAPTQIHQVMMNLCTNAVHALEEGGLLEVVLTDFVLGKRARSEFPQLAPGRYLRISVKDNGEGMNEETVERIFEPFFTTKESGEGTGMGLAVVHGIASSLKGAITVESKFGEGSVFHVVLPTIEQTTDMDSDVQDDLPSGHECILFVDDDTGITKLVGRMLEALDYQPVLAVSAPEALEVFKRRANTFDLVITDQVMPDMTGLELAAKLREIQPDIPVILCSGFSEAFSKEDAQAVGIQEFMTKPIALKDLAEAVRGTLDRVQGESPDTESP